MRSDFFHRFAHAMDKGELAAFRTSEHLNSDKWSQQRQQLFEALMRMKQFDPLALERAVEDRSYRSILAMEKHRMLQAMIATVHDLRNRRDGQSPWGCLGESQLLFDMNLAEEAAQKAQEGIRLAEAVEDIFAELQLREQLRAVYKSVPRFKRIDSITENEYRLETVIQKVANLTRYAIICDNMNDHQRKFRVADDRSVRAALDALMAEPQMADLSKAMSLPAQIRFANAQALYSESIGQLHEAEKSYDLCLSLWESSPARISYQPQFYLQTLANLIGLLIRLHDTGRVPVLLKRMERVTVSGRRAEMLAFCSTELQYQFFYMNTGQFEAFLAREPKVNKGIRSFGKLITESKMLALLYNLGVVHLIVGNNREAKGYFGRIHGKNALHSRLDLQSLSQMFRLLLLLEEDDDDRFPYYLRGYKRSFRRGMPYFRLENTVHRWLTLHHQHYHSAEGRQHLMQLYKELEEFEKKRLTGAEELRLWVLSRATARPMLELLS